MKGQLNLHHVLLCLLSVLLACASLFASEDAFAYPVTVTFVDVFGRPVSAIKVRGSHGINGLPILTSDSQGKWTFDTNDVSSPDAVIVFSGAATGMQLEPAEIKVSEILGLGLRSRTVKATQSSTPSTIVSWTYFSSYTARLAGLPVAIMNPYAYTCNYRKTDSNGYVAWSVPKPTGACNDASPTTSWYQIVPAEDTQVRCSTFTTTRSTGARSCPYLGDDEDGFSTSSCAVVSPPAPSLTSTIKVSVTAAGTTYGIPGVEVVGNANLMAVAGRQTNSLGDFAFTIGSVPGAQASTAFDITPVRTGYEFFPRVRNTRECAYVGMNTYQCKFSGVRTNTGQGAILFDVTQAGKPLSGVSVNPPAELGCIPPGVKTSDGFGRIVLPVRTRSQCGSAGSGLWNAPVVPYPTMTGKGFISPSNFEYCPTTLITQAPVSAYDSNSGVQNYAISGRVLTVAGEAFSGADLYVNDVLWGPTDSSGSFRIEQVAQGNTVKLSAKSGDFKFDPEFETFLEVGSDVQTLIHARAPDPFAGGIDPPSPSCPVQEDYEVSGFVLDIAGSPQQGVEVFVNDGEQPVAVTDFGGRYSFRMPFQSDAWVAAKKGSSNFGPMARSLNNIECDESNVDFQEVSFDSVVISGTIVDLYGMPLEGIDVGVRVDGVPLAYSVTSSGEGTFRFTVPQGAAVAVAPVDTRYVFAPSSDSIDIAGSDETTATFKADRETVPTPIASPAPIAPAPVPTAPLPAPISPPLVPQPTATPIATTPSGPIATSTPVATSTSQPNQPGNPQPAPPALTAAPTQAPFLPPGVTTPTAPTATPVVQPTQGGNPPVAATPTSPVPPIWATPGPPIPIDEPTVVPIPTAIATNIPLPPEFFPNIRVRALCNSSSQFGTLQWVVLNEGLMDLNGGWEGLNITQPNLIVGSAPIFQGAESGGVLTTSLLGTPVDYYRLHVFTYNRAGDRVTLALERWDAANCLNLPAPTPTPAPTSPSWAPPVGAPTPPSGGQPPVGWPPGGEPAPGPGLPPVDGAPPTSPIVPTATPTPIPTPLYEISGGLRDGVKNEQLLSPAVARILVGLGAAIEIRGMSGSEFINTVPFSQLVNNKYRVSVPAGKYRIRIIARRANSLRVQSVFRKNATEYTCVLPGTTSRCRNVSFIVTPRSLLRGGG